MDSLRQALIADNVPFQQFQTPHFLTDLVHNVAKYGTISQVSLRGVNDTFWLIGSHNTENLYSFVNSG